MIIEQKSCRKCFEQAVILRFENCEKLEITYKNRYLALHSDTDGESWQEVDNGKGKGQRQRRSTGGTYS